MGAEWHQGAPDWAASLRNGSRVLLSCRVALVALGPAPCRRHTGQWGEPQAWPCSALAQAVPAHSRVWSEGRTQGSLRSPRGDASDRTGTLSCPKGPDWTLSHQNTETPPCACLCPCFWLMSPGMQVSPKPHRHPEWVVGGHVGGRLRGHLGVTRAVSLSLPGSPGCATHPQKQSSSPGGPMRELIPSAQGFPIELPG